MSVFYYDVKYLPNYLMYWSNTSDSEITSTLPPYIIFIHVAVANWMIIRIYPKYVTYLITNDFINIKYMHNLLHLIICLPGLINIDNVPQYLITIRIKGYDNLINQYPQYLAYLHENRRYK
jgi:hypothetical protein